MSSSGCTFPAGAFVWPESAKKGAASSYDAPGDYAGRWSNREYCTLIEVHPDGRFRWMNHAHGRKSLCVAAGRLIGQGESLRWWRKDDVDDYEKNTPREQRCDLDAMVPTGWIMGPPFETRAEVMFPSADVLVLGYVTVFPLAVRENRRRARDGKPGEQRLFLRFARVGSGADAPFVPSSDFTLHPGLYAVDAEDKRGELTVRDEKLPTGRPYELRWIGGSTERGTMRCVRLGTAGCDGYDFVPDGGRRRMMRFFEGGQNRDLTEVASEAELKRPDLPRSWKLFELGGL